MDTNAPADDDAAALRARLRRLDASCGCEAGALTGLAAVSVYLILILAAPELVMGSPAGHIAKGAVVYVVAGAIGKLVALALIRHRRAGIRAALMQYDDAPPLTR